MIKKKQNHNTIFLLISLNTNHYLKFNYIISNQNIKNSTITNLNIYIIKNSKTTTPPYIFNTNTKNS